MCPELFDAYLLEQDLPDHMCTYGVYFLGELINKTFAIGNNTEAVGTLNFLLKKNVEIDE